MIDWKHARSVRFSNERPPGWPDGVFAISLEGVTLLGVHEQTNKLYWDGREIVTRHIVQLGTLANWLAVFSTIGIFGNFALNLGHTLKWW